MNEARRDSLRRADAPRILVVEDEADLALGPTSNLEAEPRLVESPPDLVILDWMPPGVSGHEICIRSRAREATRTPPVIMVTARGDVFLWRLL